MNILKNKKIIIIFFVILLGLIAWKIFSPNYKSEPIYSTMGIVIDSDFSFTLSPNNEWLVYFEGSKGNAIPTAFNTKTKEKYSLDIGDPYQYQIGFSMKNNCWDNNSTSCVLMVLDPMENQIESELVSINGENYTIGTDKIISIDFNNETGKPKIIETLIKRKIGSGEDVYAIHETINKALTCSDCDSRIIKENNFGTTLLNREKNGDLFTSPNNRYVAEVISKELIPGQSGFYTSPNLYLKDTIKNTRKLIAKNVYYDVHFTSDSNGLYYYKCQNGGACDIYNDHLFYLNLSGDERMFEKVEKPTPVSTMDNLADKELQKIQDEADHWNGAIDAHYHILKKEFEEPQKLSPSFYTDDHYQLRLIENDKFHNRPDGYLYMRSLVGKEVRVELPPYEEFIRQYRLKDRYNLDDYDTKIWISDPNSTDSKVGVLIDVPKDPIYNEYFNDIPVDIYYNGDLVNTVDFYEKYDVNLNKI